jgi:hypothetical protein
MMFLPLLVNLLLAQTPDSGVPVRLVVTAEAHKGHDVPDIARGDVMVSQDKAQRRVEDWTPLRGERGRLQLALMIDDGLDTDLSLQFSDLKKFMRAQPATAQIGVYYMRNGSALEAQKLTPDHELAAKALRLPIGQPGAAASPFLALEDLIKKWPATTERREVLMISSGIDLYRGFPTTNPYLGGAIEKAQRAGVLVHSIYYGQAGHGGHDYFLINFGRDNLSYLGDETGGEAYWQGLATSVSFSPYLDDLAARLNNQYLLTFMAEPAKKGQLEDVKVRTEGLKVDLVAAPKVWVPGL